MQRIRETIVVVLVALMTTTSSLYGQMLSEKLPHRVITSEEIKKAGEQPFQNVLHYLLPDVFPKTDQAWLRTIDNMTLYLNSKKFEPEYINSIRSRDVQRILIWEQPWEPSPMSYPALARVKYVVSIEMAKTRRAS